MIIISVIGSFLAFIRNAIETYKIKIEEQRIENPYFRTEKGEELNKQLEGLKKYIKDYGDFKDKTAEDFYLWDDYLVYSIIFHQNDKATQKYSKYIEVK